jgi:hypothetical protein
MTEHVLYKSKSFSHMFLFRGLLMGVAVSTLVALPFLLVEGVQSITAYVMLKAVLVLFCTLYVYGFTRVFVFTNQQVVHSWRYRTAAPIAAMPYSDIESAWFVPRSNSLIGRLHLKLKSGQEMQVIMPEDHLDEVKQILRDRGVDVLRDADTKQAHVIDAYLTRQSDKVG